MTAGASDTPHAYVVGAGIAGLSCALRLAALGWSVKLFEAAGQAGGRCRSYRDERLERSIDNGNHILLSANREALSYLEDIGARDRLIGPERAVFPFVDLRSGERWTLRPGAGAIPWWILNPRRRIPGTRLTDYLAGLRLARARPQDTVADCLNPRSPLWERFWEPLTVAALNTAPEEASARLLWLVLKESFLRGEAACRPLIARDGLADCFVDPALARLKAAGASISYNRRLRGLRFSGTRIGALDFGAPDFGAPDFGNRLIEVGDRDRVVLALPPWVMGGLMPDIEVPEESRPIVNVHIRLPAPPGLPADLPFLGLVGGAADWLFVRGDVASLTVSAAGALAEEPAEAIGRRLWSDTAVALALPPEPTPPLRVIKERRATFAQTPAALSRRLPAPTGWSNLFLAGDWTDTGYPATIESAVRSGRAAARAAAGE